MSSSTVPYTRARSLSMDRANCDWRSGDAAAGQYAGGPRHPAASGQRRASRDHAAALRDIRRQYHRVPCHGPGRRVGRIRADDPDAGPTLGDPADDPRAQVPRPRALPFAAALWLGALAVGQAGDAAAQASPPRRTADAAVVRALQDHHWTLQSASDASGRPIEALLRPAGRS